MLPFPPYSPNEGVDTNQETPKELAIFFKSESDFLPPGKDFKDLTPEELELLRAQYRFTCLKPGEYQAITGQQGAE